MLDVMFNLDWEWPVWMDFRALYSACLELANYLEMTIRIIVITSSSSILLVSTLISKGNYAAVNVWKENILSSWKEFQQIVNRANQ